MANALSDIRARLKTNAEGVTGGGYTLNAARVVLGYDDFANNAEFLAALSGAGSATAGPYMVIKPGDLTDWDIQGQRGTYEIPVDLYLGIVRGTDDTFANVETFLNAIKAAWTGNAVTWALERPLDLKKDPVPVHYEMTVQAMGC